MLRGLVISGVLAACGTPHSIEARPRPQPKRLTEPSPAPAAATVAPTPSTVTAPVPGSSASAAAVEPCPHDMVAIGTRFCIDRYEAPNRAGAKPLLLQSAASGQGWCEARGKRLCREREWVRACRGPEGRDFPYGRTWRRGICNDDKTWRSPRWSAIRSFPNPAAQTETDRLDQSEPSGTRNGCVSPEGAYDMIGNAAEWVTRTEDNPTNHDHVVKGCYWARCFRPPHVPDCAYVNYAHQTEERSYEMGFRCCRDQASTAASTGEASGGFSSGTNTR